MELVFSAFLLIMLFVIAEVAEIVEILCAMLVHTLVDGEVLAGLDF